MTVNNDRPTEAEEGLNVFRRNTERVTEADVRISLSRHQLESVGR